MPKKRRRKKRKNNYLFYFVLILAILVAVIWFAADKISDQIDFSKNDKTKLDSKQVSGKSDVQSAIDHSQKLLGIPEELCKLFVGKDAVYITIYLDREQVDLNYANMIITGQVEQADGEIVSGKEKYNGAMQELVILDKQNQQKYIVRLKYAEAGKYPAKKPVLSIIVDDFGYFKGKLLTDFCALDKNVTFAILPGLAYSGEVMMQARSSEHETIIHAPMEPLDYPRNDPGKNAVFVHDSRHEIKRKVKSYIKELPFCVGLNNHMGSMVTSDKEIMNTVLQVIKENDLYFVDSRTTSSSVAYSTAQEMMIPSLENTMFIDSPDISRENMKKRLNELKNMMDKGKKIVVITHSTNRKKYEYLKEFIKEIKAIGYRIVPVSYFFENNLPEFI